jgi:hypothetical protein
MADSRVNAPDLAILPGVEITQLGDTKVARIG